MRMNCNDKYLFCCSHLLTSICSSRVLQLIVVHYHIDVDNDSYTFFYDDATNDDANEQTDQCEEREG
jgi:hypothetical protein